MNTASSVLPAGTWAVSRAHDEVLIDYERRFRRRFLLHTESGADLLLDLPQATRLREGDGLLLQDGRVVRVRARAEALMEVTAGDPALLLRIAWHLGNRHLPVQFDGDRMRLRTDHVIAAMVEGLGGRVAAVQAPFDPEAGAYAGGHTHHHDDDDHDHHHHHHD